MRRVVADRLGVAPETLTREVSLTDDLAADSLDLAELSFAFEDEFDISVPDATLDEVRTYGELVETVQALNRRRQIAQPSEETSPPPVYLWMHLVAPPDRTGGDLFRAAWLTPYTAETIVAEALRAGPGARLQLSAPANVSVTELADIRRGFRWLGEHGVAVTVHRDAEPGRRQPSAAA